MFDAALGEWWRMGSPIKGQASVTTCNLRKRDVKLLVN